MKNLMVKTTLVVIIILISSFSVSAEYLYDSSSEWIDSSKVWFDGNLRRKIQEKELKIAQRNYRSSRFDQYPLPESISLDYGKKEMDEKGRRCSLEFSISHLRGHSTYEIGGMTDDPNIGNLHFPISKLEFPLKSYIASLRANVDITKRWNLTLGLKIDISSNAGRLKDSDWGYYWFHEKYELNEDTPWAEQNSFDIYSESEADLDVLILDFNLRYHIYKNTKFQFFTGIGYKNQSFDYEVSNTDQWYPSFEYYYNLPDTPEYFDDPNIVGSNPSGHDYYKGKTLLYNISYNIPYMEIGMGFRVNRLSGEASCGYSPIVNIRDEDYHILRAKKSYGNTDGDAFIFSLKGNINFDSGWFVSLGFSYTEISTEGIQTQYEYSLDGVGRIKIDQEIKSLQRLFSFSFGYIW